MKKLIVIIGFCAGIALGQAIKNGTTLTYIADPSNGTASCTNYYGWAVMNGSYTNNVSINSAVWKIKRVVLDSSGEVLEYTHAYGTASGDNASWSTAWTNRLSATYR